MGCGCTQSAADTRAKAARCHMCIYAEHGPDAVNDGATLCTINGRPVVGLSVCPRGYFDQGPFMRWLGIRWIGLPIFIRWFLWAFKRSRPNISSWSGCGCSVVLKTWYNKARPHSVVAPRSL